MRSLKKFGFDIVRGCQLRCVGCPLSTLKTKIEYIDPDTFVQILRNVDVDRVELLRLFNFGEPLLHPKVLRIVRSIGMAPWVPKEVEISTNAQVTRLPDLTGLISDKIITRMAVSCDGDGTPQDYERLRPPAKWEKLGEFLRIVGRLRKKHNPKLELITRTICTSEKGQKRWKKLLKPLGWKPLFRGKWELPEAQEFHRPRKIPGGACLFVGKRKGRRLYVDVDGSVVPCCHHPRAFVMGNLTEQTYVEMRKSEHYHNMVKQLNKRKNIRICKDCDRP